MTKKTPIKILWLLKCRSCPRGKFVNVLVIIAVIACEKRGKVFLFLFLATEKKNLMRKLFYGLFLYLVS